MKNILVWAKSNFIVVKSVKDNKIRGDTGATKGPEAPQHILNGLNYKYYTPNKPIITFVWVFYVG